MNGAGGILTVHNNAKEGIHDRRSFAGIGYKWHQDLYVLCCILMRKKRCQVYFTLVWQGVLYTCLVASSLYNKYTYFMGVDIVHINEVSVVQIRHSSLFLGVNNYFSLALFWGMSHLLGHENFGGLRRVHTETNSV